MRSREKSSRERTWKANPWFYAEEIKNDVCKAQLLQEYKLTGPQILS